MKIATQYPRDLDGRMIHCELRARAIAEALMLCESSDERKPFSREALTGLGYAAEELADELVSLHKAIVAEDWNLEEAEYRVKTIKERMKSEERRK